MQRHPEGEAFAIMGKKKSLSLYKEMEHSWESEVYTKCCRVNRKEVEHGLNWEFGNWERWGEVPRKGHVFYMGRRREKLIYCWIAQKHKAEGRSCGTSAQTWTKKLHSEFRNVSQEPLRIWWNVNGKTIWRKGSQNWKEDKKIFCM